MKKSNSSSDIKLKSIVSKKDTTKNIDDKKNKKSPIAFIKKHKKHSLLFNLLYGMLVSIVTLVTSEYVARGTFANNKGNNGFFQALQRFFPSFVLAFLVLFLIYVIISQLSGWHPLATALTCPIGLLPALATYFKLASRGEPFLPWDLNQIGDLKSIGDEIELSLPKSFYIAIACYIVLLIGSLFIGKPATKKQENSWLIRFVTTGSAGIMMVVLFLGVFLNPAGSQALGITEDAWMQDRYYRKHTVLTGFFTNLQMLKVDKPAGYTTEKVVEIAEKTEENKENTPALFSNSYAATTEELIQKPNIVFLMGESFWDVTNLDGIEYDQPLLTNLEALQEQSAYGTNFSAHMGGGTCDIEFEVLTGFSMENLPASSKPYQQYLTQDTFSLPNYLKHEQDYETVAIHGYGRQFWNRDVAYPHLGIDTFIAEEDFPEDVERKRGLISDNAMADAIIEQLSNKEDDAPLFIHSVSMQNHTSYNRSKQNEEDLVHVTEYPDDMPDKSLSALEDIASNIRDMDATIGKITEFLSTYDEPTIFVFWGDHVTGAADDNALFTSTNFINDKDDLNNPNLYSTPVLIWSNYSQTSIDMGTLSSYNIAPVMMDLYGLEKPVFFEYLSQQYNTLHGRTHALTIETDNVFSSNVTDSQQKSINNHAILQYDAMFGAKTLDTYTSALKTDVNANSTAPFAQSENGE